jgi:hypothetical protein
LNASNARARPVDGALPSRRYCSKPRAQRQQQLAVVLAAGELVGAKLGRLGIVVSAGFIQLAPRFRPSGFGCIGLRTWRTFID